MVFDDSFHVKIQVFIQHGLSDSIRLYPSRPLCFSLSMVLRFQASSGMPQ